MTIRMAPAVRIAATMIIVHRTRANMRTLGLRLLPSGDHRGAPERVKSSGLPAYDQAVERAIVRCDPVPRPADMNPQDMPRELRLIFDPVDDNANK